MLVNAGQYNKTTIAQQKSWLKFWLSWHVWGIFRDAVETLTRSAFQTENMKTGQKNISLIDGQNIKNL